MLAPVGEDDERRLQVLGVAAGLLLGIVGVKVFTLGFQDAKHSAEAVFKQVVGPAVRGV